MIKLIFILVYVRLAYFACKIVNFNYFIQAMLIIVKFATLIQNLNAQYAINATIFYNKNLH